MQLTAGTVTLPQIEFLFRDRYLPMAVELIASVLDAASDAELSSVADGIDLTLLRQRWSDDPRVHLEELCRALIASASRIPV